MKVPAIMDLFLDQNRRLQSFFRVDYFSVMRSYHTLNGIRASADVRLAPRPTIEGAPGESLCALQLAPPDAAILAKAGLSFSRGSSGKPDALRPYQARVEIR